MSASDIPAQTAPSASATSNVSQSRRHGKRFLNSRVLTQPGLLQNLRIAWRFLTKDTAHTIPGGSIPVRELSQSELLQAPDNTLYRLGHSTLLMKIGGGFWLTDPVFSERASPFSWLGPQRFHQPPISLQDLPQLRGVILSHDHYDHLDHATILQLKDKTAFFLTPTGVGQRLIRWGVAPSQVREHAWWDSSDIDSIRFVATPAQHFSGRSVHDRDQTLWASWSIISPELRIFFSGDSGYFSGFKEIGDKLGPFDLSLIETGAYDPMWPDIHMQPEQSLQAHLDLRARTMLPIHNGTFDLAMHHWYEPFERITQLAARQGVRLSTPQMGEAVDIAEPQQGRRWWLFPSTRGSNRRSFWCHACHE
ncbi:MBL fold metallo-hydrolase [Undibacterium rugosum]|uniref:MBL fold metallo-hydrolase n=1 Tax=Undibacterium rugosum TaxID=2762291 RepID=UPI001B8368A4|nr:MBL fold metallo-hydrolase [Undibacterium rugosum]MBR7777009.1 MBL fold metallo-hydrolase [Undibacterium rugosum]